MAEPIRKLEAEALKLSNQERAELARVLLLSLDEVEDEADEAAWAEEAERRYRELRSGAVEAIPSDQVLAEARARLG
jgi:putative addiction module component (TIGR02574 family)